MHPIPSSATGSSQAKGSLFFEVALFLVTSKGNQPKTAAPSCRAQSREKNTHTHTHTHTHTLQLPREGANPSSTTDESRVGEVSARDALGFPLVTKTLPERTRSTNSAATKGPNGHSESRSAGRNRNRHRKRVNCVVLQAIHTGSMAAHAPSYPHRIHGSTCGVSSTRPPDLFLCGGNSSEPASPPHTTEKRCRSVGAG